MTVAVLLSLPDDVYLALASIATGKETQVHRMLEVTLTRQVRTPPKKAWRKFSDSEIERCRELNAQGWSDNQIAKAIGRSQGPVSTRLRAMGLPSPTPRNPSSGRQARAA